MAIEILNAVGDGDFLLTDVRQVSRHVNAKLDSVVDYKGRVLSAATGSSNVTTRAIRRVCLLVDPHRRPLMLGRYVVRGRNSSNASVPEVFTVPQ